MYKITLEWFEEGHQRSRTFSSKDNTKEKGKIFIGRDEEKCDIILPLNEKSVSRLHVVIFYDFQKNCFLLKNLTSDRPQPNPVIVDGKKIIAQQANISLGTVIQLGKITLKIRQLDIIKSQQLYGLKCPNGHQIPFDYVGDFCPHCGFSLQAGQTIVLPQD
ncbi:FHA domain-containing protein [Plectonema cf. radiosum LEGE 06105]|uniref:FHA domain-containing protein n=1 Tax=Plectonema cf. radiosum LEGE 06105 TaxID=945769 RepID=A0A8J7JTV7_9CYAN|nr:FHA domain-containing protein [Plectonema radiosum]MBE9214289.1 FHA domain-containing protein [Plectonema cf. radiosum LEGE 06105]